MKKLPAPKISIESMKVWIQSIERKTLINAGIIAGIFIAFILFILLPIGLHNKKVGSEAKNLKDKLSQANIKIAKIPLMVKQKEQFGARITKNREQFFDLQETDKLIEIISTAAGDSGVKIIASRPSVKVYELPTPFDNKYIPLSYELVLEGPYHSIGSFINKFESYKKTFAVHDVQIAKSDKSDTNQAIMNVTAFVKQAAV